MTIGQTAKTLTLTSDHLVAGALKLRLQYRGDFADHPFFVNDKGVLKDWSWPSSSASSTPSGAASEA